jgi:hypothetical protein
MIIMLCFAHATTSAHGGRLERRDDFEKLRQALIAELAPTGALEEDIVANIARLVWRKRNLATLLGAEDDFRMGSRPRGPLALS